jgi:anti-sigma B factor antagonist
MAPRSGNGQNPSTASWPLLDVFLRPRRGIRLIDKAVRADSRRLGAGMALTIQTQMSGDVFVLGCNGRIVSFDDCAVLRETVGNMLRETLKIVVNLKEVDYIDSEGVGLLVGLLVSARNRGGELKLASLGKRVEDVLRRTNLDTIFAVYANNDEAVAAFGKQVA